MNYVKLTTLALATVLVSACSESSISGDQLDAAGVQLVDQSGNSGTRPVEDFFLKGDGVPNKLLITKQGKILSAGLTMAGQTGDDCSGKYLSSSGVWQRNANGTTDTQFGNRGARGLFNIPCRALSIFSIAEQNDGKLLVAGTERYGSGGASYDRVVVMRLNADGRELDLDFNGGGEFLISHASVASVSVLANGNILVSGTKYNQPRHDWTAALWLLASNGSIEKQYYADFAGYDFSTTGHAVQSNGEIVVVGTLITDMNAHPFKGDVAVLRFNQDLILDDSFGQGGIFQNHGLDLGTEPTYGQSIAVLPDDSLVIGGYSMVTDSGGYVVNAKTSWFVLWKLSASGKLDLAFNDKGYYNESYAYTHRTLSSIAVQADGKIVAAAWRPGLLSISRFYGDGSVDAQFDSITHSCSLGCNSAGIAIQPDGKIVMNGVTDNAVHGGWGESLWRLSATSE